MKLTPSIMLLPIVIAMTALSAKGEGAPSLRGDLQRQLAEQSVNDAAESSRAEDDHLPEGEGDRSLQISGNCDCRWDNPPLFPCDNDANCTPTKRGCGWFGRQACTGWL